MLEHWTPYRPELAKEYEEKGYWKKENFSQVFDNIAERFWEREALVGGDQRYTYGELKKGTDRLALHFVKMGLKHQDRVVVQLINIPEFVFIYIALQKIGVIPVMCLPQHRYTEISQIAAKAEAVGYIIPGFAKKYNYVELVEQVAADLPSMKLKMIAGVNQEVPEGYYYINELLNTPIEGEDDAELLRSYLPDPHDVCIILLSGGTTGIPKLIAREYNAYRYVAEESSRELGYNMYTVQLAVAPVAHNMVLAAPGIQGAFSFGGKVVMSTSPKTEDICKLIEKEHITHIPMVPAMIINMLNFEDRQKYDLSSWEIVINGGSKIEPVVAARVYPELGCRLISQFGMSEGTITQTSLFDSEEVTYNTIGLPVSPADEWKIVDKDENKCRDMARTLSGVAIACADFIDPEVQNNENIFRTDALISTTHADDTNLLMCMNAMRHNSRKVITRYFTREYEDIFQYTGIETIIGYYRIITNEITKSTISDEMAMMRSRDPDEFYFVHIVDRQSKLLDRYYGDLNIPDGVRIVAVKRGTDIIYPRLDSRFQDGDSVIVFTSYTRRNDLIRVFGKSSVPEV